jgi:glycerol-3-phosphate acyltransferase PlsY
MLESLSIFIAITICSYLIGSIPTSIITSKLIKGIDIRNFGSGNAGGTNTIRLLGWKIGIAVILVDILKGMIATYFIARLGHDKLILANEMIGIWAGLMAIIGHIWTIFAGFKGGKGIAVAGGMLFILYPLAFTLCLIWFLLVAFTTRYVSVASISAAILLPIILLLMRNLMKMSISLTLIYFAVFIALLIVFTHRANIRRLIQGKENRFAVNKSSRQNGRVGKKNTRSH